MPLRTSPVSSKAVAIAAHFIITYMTDEAAAALQAMQAIATLDRTNE